jgi:hypothetical protein
MELLRDLQDHFQHPLVRFATTPVGGSGHTDQHGGRFECMPVLDRSAE